MCVVHGAGPQISREMERRRHPGRVRRRAARHDARTGSGSCGRRSPPSTRALCKAIGDRAVPLIGDEIGLKVDPVPELGLVGEPVPSLLPAIVAVLDAGKIPVVSPIAEARST